MGAPHFSQGPGAPGPTRPAAELTLLVPGTGEEDARGAEVIVAGGAQSS